MSIPLEIKAATAADLPALLALYEHLTAGEPPPKASKAAEILQRFERFDGSQIMIGWHGKNAVASCALVVIPNLTRSGTPYALIENVVTHTAYRTRGFGRAVLAAAVEAAWAAGCYKVMLLAGSSAPQVMHFYEGAGFTQSKTGFQIRRLPLRPA